MDTQVDFPTFAGDRASAINDRLRAYKEAKLAEKQAEESKKNEIASVKSHYDYYIDRAKNEQERLKTELQGFINVDEGETSLTTSMGNIHLIKNKDHWNWPSASKSKKIIEELPKEMIKEVPTLDKDAIKKNTTVTDDGKVIITDTGQIIDGLSVVVGKGQSVAIKTNRED